MRRIKTTSPEQELGLVFQVPIGILAVTRLGIVLARLFGQPAPAPLADAPAGG
jgi:hypothetical protein